MQVVLASFFEISNHGNGRKIGISPGKPNNLEYECDLVFEPFSPGDLYWDYHKNKKEDYDSAGEIFVSSYKEKLEAFFQSALEESQKQGKDIQEILPFQDGDTFLSWEKKGNTSYRAMLADYLRDFGYEVEEN